MNPPNEIKKLEEIGNTAVQDKLVELWLSGEENIPTVILKAYKIGLDDGIAMASTWKTEDPRMLREQIRVADEAFQRLCEENKTLRACIKDDCETEEEVKNLARPILGVLAVDGDSYGVPTEADIVKSLVKKLKGTNAHPDNSK